MKTFRCACGTRVFFENTRCLTCARELGFVPRDLAIVALEPMGADRYRPAGGEGAFKKCQNNAN